MRYILALGVFLSVGLIGSVYGGLAPSGVDFTGKRESTVTEKRFEKKTWTGGGTARLSEKRFRIEEWDKHYSSVGSKRAPITVKEDGEKQMFRSSTKSFPEKTYEMSRWNKEIADLHERARIGTDDRAMKIAERRTYETAVGEAESYADTGEEVSLRDINRYQFRRNRPEGGVPVRKAGEGN